MQLSTIQSKCWSSGLMFSELNSRSRHVQAQAKAGVTMLCSWARPITLTVPLSTKEGEWMLDNCQGNLVKCRAVTCHKLASHLSPFVLWRRQGSVLIGMGQFPCMQTLQLSKILTYRGKEYLAIHKRAILSSGAPSWYHTSFSASWNKKKSWAVGEQFLNYICTAHTCILTGSCFDFCSTSFLPEGTSSPG